MDAIKVRHKLTNELMTIKKINGEIVTCFIQNPYFIFGWILIDVAICHKDNLIYEA
jgi:hypothetical protein